MSFSLIMGNKSNYFSQRDNELCYVNGDYKVDWSCMCNVTALCESLKIAGYSFPQGDYKQPEDNLANFILHSEKIDNLYLTRYPSLYKQWKVGNRTSYSPLEIHDLLSIGVNYWFNKTVDIFYTNMNINLILNQVINNRIPVPTSVKFGSLNHIISITGASWDNLDEEEAKVCNVKPDCIFYDDPYGKWDFKLNRYTEKDILSGYCNRMSYSQFISSIKPLDSNSVKWAHIICKK